MYRCYFMRAAQISRRFELQVSTLDAAIATGQKLMVDQLDPDDIDRLEIWLDTALLYEFTVARRP